jgi:hypothetical protein
LIAARPSLLHGLLVSLFQGGAMGQSLKLEILYSC